MSRILEVEIKEFLGRGRYERKPGKKNHRNGSYKRSSTAKNLGTLNIKMLRDRYGEFESQTLEKYKLMNLPLKKTCASCFCQGCRHVRLK